MNTVRPRPMSFEIRPIEGAMPDQRWHWLVYDDPEGHFIRNGQVVGDRDKAEQTARAAVAIMGGVVREPLSKLGERAGW